MVLAIVQWKVNWFTLMSSIHYRPIQDLVNPSLGPHLTCYQLQSRLSLNYANLIHCRHIITHFILSELTWTKAWLCFGMLLEPFLYNCWCLDQSYGWPDSPRGLCQGKIFCYIHLLMPPIFALLFSSWNFCSFEKYGGSLRWLSDWHILLSSLCMFEHT